MSASALAGCRLYESLPEGEPPRTSADIGPDVDDVRTDDTSVDARTDPDRLTIRLSYTGEASLQKAEVYVHESPATCDELRAVWDLRRTGQGFDTTKRPGAEATKTTPLMEASSGPSVEGEIDLSDDVEGGDEYTVWARGLESASSDDAPPVEQAWGCTRAPLDPTIEVELADHLPILRETYQLEHSFDLTAELPQSLRQTARRLALLVQSPGSFLLGCDTSYTISIGSETVKPCPNAPVDGVVDIYRAADTDFAGVYNDFVQVSSPDELRGLIDEAVLANAYDTKPWEQAFSDQPASSLALFEYPDMRGLLSTGQPGPPDKVDGRVEVATESAQIGLSEFGFPDLSDRDCPAKTDYDACTVRWFAADDLLNEPSRTMGISAASRRGEGLSFPDAFELPVGFVRVWEGAIEQVFLQHYFAGGSSTSNSAVVDADQDQNGSVTWDEIGQLVLPDCDVLLASSSVSDRSDSAQDVFTEFCEKTREEITNDLDALILEAMQIEESENFVRLQTPDNTPCPLLQPAAYTGDWPEAPLPFAEQLGQQSSRCEWTSRFGFAKGDSEGSWWGQLK